jgi:hypothetical protein
MASGNKQIYSRPSYTGKGYPESAMERDSRQDETNESKRREDGVWVSHLKFLEGCPRQLLAEILERIGV